MNTVNVEQITNTVDVETYANTVEVSLIDVKTIQYGFMGFQQYEGVEPIEQLSDD